MPSGNKNECFRVILLWGRRWNLIMFTDIHTIIVSSLFDPFVNLTFEFIWVKFLTWLLHPTLETFVSKTYKNQSTKLWTVSKHTLHSKTVLKRYTINEKPVITKLFSFTILRSSSNQKQETEIIVSYLPRNYRKQSSRTCHIRFTVTGFKDKQGNFWRTKLPSLSLL